MPEVAPTILKKQVIRPAAARMIAPAVIAAPAAARPVAAAPADGGEAVSARIVEQTAAFAVVEVCCACGRKIRLQCDYAA
jgi:hypothetical protein